MSRFVVALMCFAVACGKDETEDSGGAEEALDGAALYDSNCAVCHGADGTGEDGQYPDLTVAVPTLTAEEINTIILDGQGTMPDLNIAEDEAQAITDYLVDTFG